MSLWRTLKKIFPYFYSGERLLWRKTEPVSGLGKGELIPYPLSFAHIITGGYFPKFDTSGIPLGVSCGGHHYNPTAVCGYAFGLFELFCKYQRPKDRDDFLKQAGWLLSNQRVEERSGKKVGVWIYDYEDTYSGASPPWISGMAQGQAISVLLRAHALVNDERYLEAACLAFEPFQIDLREGGVRSFDFGGLIFFEETPSDPPCHVLNGFIYSIIGIRELYDHTGDRTALALFNQAITTLERVLPLYDLGFWSSYDLPSRGFKNPASLWYHDVHIVLLDVLFEMTGKPIFASYSWRWRQYRNGVGNRLLGLGAKVLYKGWRRLSG
ncbi:MAG TPA: hypothetical protein EYP53_06715 [Candidatus Latescibacteria bacterium]|nr:hypothetical protein [Candidatus Latescibacterota bacterium]